MCDPILVIVLNMRPHDSQSSRENATPSSGTSPLACYKEVPPPPDFKRQEKVIPLLSRSCDSNPAGNWDYKFLMEG